ncbi:MAG: M48 family metalloprotease [Rhodospirillaceae bacterium]|nr:M48 family metalloprotease [Rhodospirillaceae bacterium]
MNQLNKIQNLFFWFAAIALPLQSQVAMAQGFGLIRDTEIEQTIQAYANPILETAGLPPKSVTIRIIADNSLNAFVTTGNRMFLNTGTLMAANSSSEIIGVIAHETGHLVGGHTVTFSDQMEAALRTTLLTTLLGVAAGVATGNADLGMAVALGGQGTAQRQVLAFSRGQESSADQFALKALDQTEQSAEGLYKFFERISGQELLITDRQDPYVRTHPLTRNRMTSIRAHIDQSSYSEIAPNEELEEKHRRMVAKLYSFLKPQKSTLQKYPESDVSLPARYARSVAHYRRGRLDLSVPLIDGLIEEDPDDPYFWELKGQMLLENGRIPEAITAYKEATRLLPFAPLILVAQAHAMVESGDPAFTQETQDALRIALQVDPNDIFAWNLSAKSYAINNQLGMSAYAAAERALLLGQFGDVVRFTLKAEEELPTGTPIWVRLQDLKTVARNYIEDQRNRRR